MNDKKPERLPFDKALAKKFQDVIQEALLDHPELRSVAVVFDFVGDLNDGGADRGVWIGEDGPVRTLEGIHGSIAQMLRMSEMMFVRAQALSNQMREDAAVIGQELVRRQKQLEDGSGAAEDKEVARPESPASPSDEG
jgi:hypothetical protein